MATDFTTFPFGLKADALEVINIWRQVLIQGQKHQIDTFLNEVQKRFESLGWSRDTVLETQWNSREHQRNHFFCWASGPEQSPGVMLCLNRASDSRVRGGTYDLHDKGASIRDLANVIQHVLAEVLEPAAAAASLEVSYPRLGPISRFGPRTTAALTALAEAGGGQWPLPEAMEPLWRTFVVIAFRDDAALNPEELTAWFAANGWEERASIELTRRFYADAALLGEFEDRRQPA